MAFWEGCRHALCLGRCLLRSDPDSDQPRGSRTHCPAPTLALWSRWDVQRLRVFLIVETFSGQGLHINQASEKLTSPTMNQ